MEFLSCPELLCARPTALPFPCVQNQGNPHQPPWPAVFSKPFHSVSDQGLGCRNESGLFAVFYHLMMVNHRLLDCSHGNGSSFQHPVPLHAVLARSCKECEMSVRTTRGQGIAAGAQPAEPCVATASCCWVRQQWGSVAFGASLRAHREPAVISLLHYVFKHILSVGFCSIIHLSKCYSALPLMV